jgi:hypothetical protein
MEQACPVVRIDLRLVVNLQFPSRQGLAQGESKLQPLELSTTGGGIVPAQHSRAPFLGTCQGMVGGEQQAVGRLAAQGEGSTADATGHVDRASLMVERFGQGPDHVLDPLRCVGLPFSFEEQEELVHVFACNRRPGSCRALDAPRHVVQDASRRPPGPAGH